MINTSIDLSELANLNLDNVADGSLLKYDTATSNVNDTIALTELNNVSATTRFDGSVK